MQQRCQKNYIILMTDGEPTKDRDHRLYDTAYINGDIIGDQDGDHASPCSGFSREYWYRDDDGTCHNYDDDGSDYLDDVAKYLHDKDCNPTMGDGTSFDKQNIVTFTIGFKSNQDLLQRTATHGGGRVLHGGGLLGAQGGLRPDHVHDRREERLLRGAGRARSAA